MKTKLYLSLILSICITFIVKAQDTEIPFDSGVLKLCSTKNFSIKGHDGKDVIIKSLHTGKTSYSFYNSGSNSERVLVRNTRVTTNTRTTREARTPRAPRSNRDSLYVGFFYNTNEVEKSKGLKKLGKKAAAEESGIFLKIEQVGNELRITDNYDDMFVMVSDERYEISIPNSIKLDWDTNGCSSKRHTRFFTSKASELKDFKGEVEITSTLNNIKLTDVSGPVTINTIGGNVTAKFVKTVPNKLYSIYSNNGFIDITLPEKSNVTIDAAADDILSDLDFNVISETDTERGQKMKLKLGNGKVKMKLDAGYGNIYLRK